MATSINIELGYKDAAWFAANPTKVLLAGQIVYLQQTGTYKIGDGTTTLSALSFLGGTPSTPTIQQVLTAGSTATTTITTTGFIKTAGTSAEFLKANGSVDSSTYLTTLGTSATSITTTGTSGASTLIANVLNVPNYTLAGLGGTTLAAVNAQNLSVFAATTSLQLKNIISDETGSGALVFGTSPTFTTDITTPQIIGGTAVGSGITYTSTSGIGTVAGSAHIFNGGTNGATAICTFYNNGIANIGNKAITTQRLVRIGQDTAWIDIGSQSGSTTRAAIYLNQTTPDTTNYALSCHQTTGNTYLNSSSGISLLINGGILHNFDINTVSFAPTLRNGGSNTPFTFTCAADLNQVASTNTPYFKITGATKTFLTGALATQYFNYFTDNTIAFVAASTATDSYNTYIESVVAGTNATLTRKYSLGTSDNVAFGIGNSSATLHLGVAPSASNYMLSNAAGAGSTYLNAPTSGFIVLSIAGSNKFQVNNSSYTFTPSAVSTTQVVWEFRNASNTNQTLSTNVPNFQVTGNNKQWNTGTLATQYFNYFSANTLAFTGASTATNVYALYVEAATAGTNATITNNYALGLAGSLSLATVGSKIAIKEGTGGFLGQVALVAGTKAITVSGVTTSSRAFVQLVTPNTITLTVNHQVVCTANTVTITALVAAGTINVADLSTLNYLIIQGI